MYILMRKSSVSKCIRRQRFVPNRRFVARSLCSTDVLQHGRCVARTFCSTDVLQHGRFVARTLCVVQFLCIRSFNLWVYCTPRFHFIGHNITCFTCFTILTNFVQNAMICKPGFRFFKMISLMRLQLKKRKIRCLS